MANPTPLTYAAPSSPVAGGRIVSVPMDVSANVWTPTKDAAGRIRLGSWANLPINEWCVVSGAALSQIAAQLDAIGINRAAYDYGTSNGTIAPTITPWTGVAVDHESGDVWFPRGGGHADSSFNGVWRLNLETMGGGAGWHVEHLPSNPDAPGFEWSSEYRASGSFTTYIPYTTTTHDSGDILPDGKPTSSHTYGGVWFDPVRKKVGTSRYSRWQYNTLTKQWDRGLWTALAGPMGIYGHAHWDKYRSRVIIISQQGLTSVRFAYDDSDQSVTTLPAPTMTGSDPSTWSSASDGEKIWLIGATNSGERYAIFDIATLTWISSGVCGGATVSYDYTYDMCGLAHDPINNKLLHIISRQPVSGYRVRELDLATMSFSSPSQAGYPIVQTNNRWIGNKLFYYARRKCFVLIDPAASGDSGYCIFIKRVG